jgi:rod shape-determining protein MreD
MIREIVPIVLRFFGLLLIQGLLLINLDIFGGYGHLNLYVLVILLLPIKSPRILDMVIAFFLGLGVDMFYNSPGIHASAAVVLAYSRPLVIRILTPRDDYDFTDRPSISSLGLSWYLRYAIALLFVHSLWLYTLEAFDLSYFFDNILKAGLSTILTLVTILIIDYLFAHKAKV